MKVLFGLLTIFLISPAANAASQLRFNGHLVTNSGNFQAGDTFEGQFTLNPTAPDISAYQTLPQVSRPRLELTYLNNKSSSIAINGGPSLIGNDKIEVHFDNDLNLTQVMIEAAGFTGKIAAGTYDSADISDTAGFPQSPAIGFSILALFPQNTFTAEHVQNQDHMGIFDLDLQPLFLGFGIRERGASASAAYGLIDHASVNPVPVPGAFLLFGSALVGLTLRLRKSA
ncbi:hypothetical protein [Methylomonas fluvii]|uniref:PEP-CTERM sorting domain-containing protein n=1 Tax=Methylomonas fluvii TaxID=1854564 RepID=A0ABR9DHV9_9GAMM|nr:hypothetical protein [Methylomonas fluvii]MBD9362686.1 hypothetical protein [Methylomonas fluvii]